MSQSLQRPSIPLEIALRDLLAALDRASAASLAAGVIASCGKPHTTAEAIAVQQQVLRAMFAPRR